MRLNRWLGVLILLLSSVWSVRAQDLLPACPQVDKGTKACKPMREPGSLGDTVSVKIVFPVAFKGVGRGFRAYGFSSHSPLPFETFWNMSKDDMPEYLQEINRLKQKYSDQLEIYAGLEIDYLDETYNASIPYFQELPLDYRIGSIHFLPVSERLVEENMVCIDGSFREYAHSVERHFEGDVRLLVKRFFDTTMKMIEAGGIDIVGHMDKIYMNGQKYEIFNFEEDWYRKPFEACLDLVQEKGLMVEVNTKNWTKKKELYPRVEYLSRMREMNIPVMVNSDCHYPDLVNDGRKEAFKLLKQAGFKSTRELVKGKWQDIAL